MKLLNLSEYRPLFDPYEDLEDLLSAYGDDIPEKFRSDFLTALRELIIEMEIPEEDIDENIEIEYKTFPTKKLIVGYQGNHKTSTGETQWYLYLNESYAGEDAWEVFEASVTFEYVVGGYDSEYLFWFVDRDELRERLKERIVDLVQESPEQYEKYLDHPHEPGTPFSEDDISDMIENWSSDIDKLREYKLLSEAETILGDECFDEMANLVDQDAVIREYLDGYEMELDEIAGILDTFDETPTELPSGALAFGIA